MLATLLLFCTIAVGMVAQNYKQVNDICYTVKTDAYARERLKLDVYYPEGKKDCPVIVWFHGGGLEGGNKQIPRRSGRRLWRTISCPDSMSITRKTIRT